MKLRKRTLKYQSALLLLGCVLFLAGFKPASASERSIEYLPQTVYTPPPGVGGVSRLDLSSKFLSERLQRTVSLNYRDLRADAGRTRPRFKRPQSFYDNDGTLSFNYDVLGRQDRLRRR